jgi:hypothetical protein
MGELGAGRMGSVPGRGKISSSATQGPSRLWDPNILLSKEMLGPLFQCLKQQQCESDNSPLRNAEVKNGEAISHSPTRFIAWCLISSEQGEITFIFKRTATINITYTFNDYITTYSSL